MDSKTYNQNEKLFQVEQNYYLQYTVRMRDSLSGRTNSKRSI